MVFRFDQHSSPARDARSKLRRQLWLQKRQERTHAANVSSGFTADGPAEERVKAPADVRTTSAPRTPYRASTNLCGLFLLFADAVAEFGGALCTQVQRIVQEPSEWTRRPRSLFPLPAPPEDLAAACMSRHSLRPCEQVAVATLVFLAIAALNHMHGERTDVALGSPTCPQLEALRGVCNRTCEMMIFIRDSGVDCENLVLSDDFWWDGADEAVCPLIADLIDTPIAAGGCDPLKYLPKSWKLVVTSASNMFPSPDSSLKKIPTVFGSQRDEYLKLVVTQLRAHKLSLSNSICGGGTVFGRRKGGSDRMREVWNGSRVSSCAVRPPAPPMLASPSCFVHQYIRQSETLYVSKRDAKCYFDQLSLPSALQPYTGRPFVYKEELLKHGLRDDELQLILGSAGASDANGWYPTSLVWCMGFSWSSSIGQQTLLSICKRSGLHNGQVLAPTQDIPAQTALQFAVATDDVMLFSTSPTESGNAAGRLDMALSQAGIVKNSDKDVNNATDCCCVGLDLVRGRRWMAPAKRMLYGFQLLVSLCVGRKATPQAMQAYMGVLQWYDLICRSKLSCYNAVYKFMRLLPHDRVFEVPQEVITELLTSICLTPWWAIHIDKPFLGQVVATDASSSYGFGGCIAELSKRSVREISRKCIRHGDAIIVDGAELDDSCIDLRRYHMNKHMDDFKVVFSVRARVASHINVLEGGAMNMGLEWILRRPERHAHRVVMLLDSRVIVGAASKGRNSAPALAHVLRKTAALVMAGDLVPHFVFVRSRQNPADAPSRGIRTRSTLPRSLRRLQHRMALRRKARQRLADMGHGESDTD